MSWRSARGSASALLVGPTDRLEPPTPAALEEIAPRMFKVGVAGQHAARPLEPVDLLDGRRPLRYREFPQFAGPHRRLRRLQVSSLPFTEHSVVSVRCSVMHRGVEVALADANGPALVQGEPRDAEQAHADRHPRWRRSRVVPPPRWTHRPRWRTLRGDSRPSIETYHRRGGTNHPRFTTGNDGHRSLRSGVATGESARTTK